MRGGTCGARVARSSPLRCDICSSPCAGLGDRERRVPWTVARRRGERRATGTESAPDPGTGAAVVPPNASPRTARGGGTAWTAGRARAALRVAREEGRGASRLPRAKMLAAAAWCARVPAGRTAGACSTAPATARGPPSTAKLAATLDGFMKRPLTAREPPPPSLLETPRLATPRAYR